MSGSKAPLDAGVQEFLDVRAEEPRDPDFAASRETGSARPDGSGSAASRGTGSGRLGGPGSAASRETGSVASPGPDSEAMPDPGSDPEPEAGSDESLEPSSANPEPGPQRPLEPIAEDQLLRAVTALVFASPDPLTDRRIAALCAGEGAVPPLARIHSALDTLRDRLIASGLPLELRSIAGGWRILTAPDSGETVKRLFDSRKTERISPAALETLAIVAYRQPVTKAEIEAIRGVQAGPILRSLVDRDLIRVSGRADVPGHPLQYSTTRGFLDRFGLSGLDDLPRDSELAR